MTMGEKDDTKSIPETTSIASDDAVTVGASTPSSLSSQERDEVAKDNISESVTPATEASDSEKADSTHQKSEDSATVVEETKKDGDSEEKNKKKKVKPRVLSEKNHGIYTIKELEAANFFVEWFKGLRASTPYMLKLSKTYWSLSPARASILIGANICKAIVPSFDLWVDKQLLDQVQRAAEGRPTHPKKLAGLVTLRMLTRFLRQGIELTQYNRFASIR